MNPAAEEVRNARNARREELRIRLRAQRRVIAQQLGIEPGGGARYPRSNTMRLLTQRPELVMRILGSVLSLFRRR